MTAPPAPDTATPDDLLRELASRHEGHAPPLSAYRAALARFPEDARVRRALVAALVEEATRRPRDEPTLAPGPAEEALELLGAAQDGEASEVSWWRAKALARAPVDRDAEAQAAFGRALAVRPPSPEDWIEAARFHAWRGRLDAALEHALNAAAEGHRQGRVLAACYATGLGRGQVATEQWRALGLQASVRASSGMPEVEGVPDAQIRVPARGPAPLGLGGVATRAAAFELLPVTPLSPAHGVVVGAAFLDAVVDFGDVVLWEPVPVAQLPSGAPCFPLLEVLRRGEELRLRVLAVARDPGALDALEGGATPATVAWHRRLGTQAGPTVAVGKLLVRQSADLEAARLWVEGARGAALALACPALYDRLGDAARAGKEHKAWAALEGKARRLLGDPAP